MDEQVTVSIQLSAGALGQLAQLLEQAHRLMDASAQTRPPAAEESEASPSFDSRRFQELWLAREERTVPEGTAPPRQEIPTSAGHSPEAAAAQPPAFGDLGDAASAQATVLAPVGDAPTADRPFAAAPSPALSAQPSAFAELSPQSGSADVHESPPQAPAAQPAAPAADIPPAAPAAAQISGYSPEAQVVASTANSALSPPQPRRGNIQEELVEEGPAPLTAEAVSLAFRRDDRRYDRGFPLY